ncbi:MAG: symmetrical bis(5'-nucleosyl)-tetraphosphatase, partial [Burkholderiaceae bacterium]|nr:symmetrical bis(5'-nucleosyl)-tetraphosphatase [Burkholderiaceae bacterium]
KARSNSTDPRWIFVGDLVNRGPSSLQTLRHVRALGDSAQVVLGNHDLHLLAAAHGIRRIRKDDSLNEILQAPDRDKLLDWLRHQPLARMAERHLFIHAGVLPQWSAQQTLERAREVETVLQGPNWVDFLREMYGNLPAKWEDTLTGTDRLRCIVNALTRLRFCTPNGEMEFSEAGDIEQAPTGYIPWFDAPNRLTQDVTVVFGHWSTLGLVLRPNLIALDTGCVWGGQLTAVRLEDRAVLQVDCPQYQPPGPTR